MTQLISITANGEPFQVPFAQTLPDFIRARGLNPDHVVVERNGQPLTPAQARSTTLEPHDSLEIVRLVAGG